MPALGTVDPANLRVQAHAELGLSHELAQPRRVEPHPRGGGSSGYPVWNHEEQLVRDVARCATPAVGADPAAPAALTAPLTPTSRLSAQCPTSPDGGINAVLRRRERPHVDCGRVRKAGQPPHCGQRRELGSACRGHT